MFLKGGFISLQNRFLGGGLVFLLGSQLIYYGMKFNGSARLKGPIWSFVSGLHDLIALGVSAAVIGVLVLFIGVPLISVMIPDGKSKKETQEDVPLPPISLSLEELEKQRREYEAIMQEARKLHEKEQKRIKEQQLLEEQKKNEAIKVLRRGRSANAAAHAGLDDFL